MSPQVSLASFADIPALVEAWSTSFVSESFTDVFPQTRDGFKWLVRSFEEFISGPKVEGQPESKFMVIRDDDGSAVAGVIYHIVGAGDDVYADSYRARWPTTEGVPSMSDAKLAAFFNGMARGHAHTFPDRRAHIFLEVLFTHAPCRGRGFGAALVRWGNELADSLGQECYLDAAHGVEGLYRANGYEDEDMDAIWAGEPERKTRTQAMRRPAVVGKEAGTEER